MDSGFEKLLHSLIVADVGKIVRETDPAKLLLQHCPGALDYWDYSDVAPNEAVVLLIEKDNVPCGKHSCYSSWRLLTAGSEAALPLQVMSGNYSLTLDLNGETIDTVSVVRISLTAGFSPVIFRLEGIPLSIH